MWKVEHSKAVKNKGMVLKNALILISDWVGIPKHVLQIFVYYNFHQP